MKKGLRRSGLHFVARGTFRGRLKRAGQCLPGTPCGRRRLPGHRVRGTSRERLCHAGPLWRHPTTPTENRMCHPLASVRSCSHAASTNDVPPSASRRIKSGGSGEGWQSWGAEASQRRSVTLGRPGGRVRAWRHLGCLGCWRRRFVSGGSGGSNPRKRSIQIRAGPQGGERGFRGGAGLLHPKA